MAKREVCGNDYDKSFEIRMLSNTRKSIWSQVRCKQ